MLIVGVTYWLSLQGYRSVFVLGVWCFSGFAALFPLVFAALYWKRLTAAGAVSGILAMIGSWLYLFRDSEWGGNRDYAIHLPFGEGYRHHARRGDPGLFADCDGGDFPDHAATGRRNTEKVFSVDGRLGDV